MQAEINQISRALDIIASKYERLSSSCPWGREELEDLEFFRQYVTKGDRRFLSAFNGFRRLKPVAVTLYENPQSPNLPQSSCLKRFVFSGLRLAWSDYRESAASREARGLADKEESLVVKSVADRIVEDRRIDRSEQDIFEKLYKIIDQSEEDSKLKEASLDAMTTLLVSNMMQRFLKKSVLSLEQNRAGEKVLQRLRTLLERQGGALLEAMEKEVSASRDSEGQALLKEIDAMRRDKEKQRLFLAFASRKYFEKNPVEPARARRIITQGKPPGLTGPQAKAVDDLLQSLLSTLTGGGTIRASDISKIFAGAESVSLARQVFSYVKSLQTLLKDLEETKKLIERLKEKIDSNQVKRGVGANGDNMKNGSDISAGRRAQNRRDQSSSNPSKTQSLADKLGSRKRKYEELFRTIMNEVLVLKELLSMLTKDSERKSGPLGQAARAFGAVLSPFASLLDEIAEILGLKKLWSVEGLLALASEVALQVF